MQVLFALLAAALNPIIWVIVAVVLYLTRGWHGPLRVGSSVAATVALEALMAPGGSSLFPYLLFQAIIALAISSAWLLIRKSSTFEEAYPEDGNEF